MSQNRKQFTLKTAIIGFEEKHDTVRLIWKTVIHLAKWEI